MKRRLWISAGVLLLGCAVVFAVGALEQALKPQPELPSLLPEGALLSIEARDFGSLLRDWNTSEEKRAWLASDNHAAFSTSRLFTRLSQAQNEFSAAAGLPADSSLLETIAGKQSCLALYDIGNLEFVYVTRLDQQQIESTPLWQTRGKFELRSEAGSPFYVHTDAASSRTAAFAAPPAKIWWRACSTALPEPLRTTWPTRAGLPKPSSRPPASAAICAWF
jgi:hypothetical protein